VFAQYGFRSTPRDRNDQYRSSSSFVIEGGTRPIAAGSVSVEIGSDWASAIRAASSVLFAAPVPVEKFKI
jgi:hypothetical protein